VKGTPTGLGPERPSSGRRSRLEPLEFDDEEATRERAKGAMVAQRLLDRDRAAAAAAGTVEPNRPTSPESHSPAPNLTTLEHVAALRAGGYLPGTETPQMTPEKGAAVRPAAATPGGGTGIDGTTSHADYPSAAIDPAAGAYTRPILSST
jgi:hypothetical protein